MSSRQTCFWNWRRGVVTFVVVGGLGLLIPMRGEAQVDWVVKVDFSHTPDNPTYTVDRQPPTGGGCSYPAPANAYRLKICEDDTISWIVVTATGTHDATIFHEQAILDDPATNNPLPHALKAHNSTPTQKGKPDRSVKPDDTKEYAYCVAVYEQSNPPSLHVHDPKIIVGTGNRSQLSEALAELEGNVKQVQDLVSKNSQSFKSKDAAKDAEEDVQKIRTLVEEIRRKLASQ